MHVDIIDSQINGFLQIYYIGIPSKARIHVVLISSRCHVGSNGWIQSLF